MSKRLGLLASVACLLAGGGVAPAFAQNNCQWYATTALRQQQENERLRCGFTGPSWSSDHRAHVAWCGSVPPDQWLAEARKRDQDLEACAAKRK